jgi:hypothetical protein
MHQGSLCKGYVVKPYRLTLVVFEGFIDPRHEGITTCGIVYNLCRVLKLVYQLSSRLRAALGSSLIRRPLDTYMMIVNNDVIKSDL